MNIGIYTYGHQNIKEIFKEEFPNVSLTIGKFCSIASNVNVYYGHGYHDTKSVSTYPFGYVHLNSINSEKINKGKTNGNIIIGNDVWIGDNVTIMSGCKIGDGAVIATNSHIISDVPSYSIFGGNPGKLIKYRFIDQDIESLLKIKWWDWDLSKIQQNIHLLNGDNIKEFIRVNL
jgi:virginiamycin A acetyltransferase